MTKENAWEDFKEYYLQEREYDYWTAQLMWSDYVDSLRKDGQITDRQFNNWTTPFPYGKRIIVGSQKIIRYM